MSLGFSFLQESLVFGPIVQILIEDHAKLKIAFPDTKITAAPMGAMVRNVFALVSPRDVFLRAFLKKLEEQVDQTTALYSCG